MRGKGKQMLSNGLPNFEQKENIRMEHALWCVATEIYNAETAPLIKEAHHILKNIYHILENFGEGEYLDTYRQIAYDPFKKELDKRYRF